MRFPWQKRKVEQPTDFPLKLNTDNLNWCRDARLLLIEGNGTLKWESRGRNEDWSQQYNANLSNNSMCWNPSVLALTFKISCLPSAACTLHPPVVFTSFETVDQFCGSEGYSRRFYRF